MEVSFCFAASVKVAYNFPQFWGSLLWVLYDNEMVIDDHPHYNPGYVVFTKEQWSKILLCQQISLSYSWIYDEKFLQQGVPQSPFLAVCEIFDV